MDRSGLAGAYALLSDPKKTRLVLAVKDGLAVYELRGGTLLNGEFIILIDFKTSFFVCLRKSFRVFSRPAPQRPVHSQKLLH